MVQVVGPTGGKAQTSNAQNPRRARPEGNDFLSQVVVGSVHAEEPHKWKMPLRWTRMMRGIADDVGKPALLGSSTDQVVGFRVDRKLGSTLLALDWSRGGELQEDAKVERS